MSKISNNQTVTASADASFDPKGDEFMLNILILGAYG
jgi:hypothetical protein